MKIKLSEEKKELCKALTIAGILIVAAFWGLQHLPDLVAFLGKLLRVLSPFIWGIVLVFVLNPIERGIENRWLSKVKWKSGTKRKVAVGLAVLLLLAAIILFLVLLIPSLYDSCVTLGSKMGDYVSSADIYVTNLLQDNPDLLNLFNTIYDLAETGLAAALESATTYLPTFFTYSMSFVMSLGSFLIGIIVAVYLMLDREKFRAQLKRSAYAVLPQKAADRSRELIHLTEKMFNSFIIGKAIDSLIIGILCFIGMSIFQMDYSVLISFIIGLTNFIPFFGPFIGAIPSIFLLLIINPMEALWFGIFILCLQQFDGNILGPRILGDNMGLPSLWIMFSLIVGGGFFGLLGMLIGVPLMAVIYVVVKDWVQHRLEQRKPTIPSD